jgi:hypothetical protein
MLKVVTQLSNIACPNKENDGTTRKIVQNQCWGRGSDPHDFGPPGSKSISQGNGFGFGCFFFLIKVLSGLKQCLQNKILTPNFSKKLDFKNEDMRVKYKKI